MKKVWGSFIHMTGMANMAGNTGYAQYSFIRSLLFVDGPLLPIS